MLILISWHFHSLNFVLPTIYPPFFHTFDIQYTVGFLVLPVWNLSYLYLWNSFDVLKYKRVAIARHWDPFPLYSCVKHLNQKVIHFSITLKVFKIYFWMTVKYMHTFFCKGFGNALSCSVIKEILTVDLYMYQYFDESISKERSYSVCSRLYYCSNQLIIIGSISLSTYL